MYTIKSYKAFNKDLKCKGFQYKIGKQYTFDGNIEICTRGFHACENPLMVLNYYPISTSRFARTEQSGTIEADEKTSKICSSKISIIEEIDLLTLIRKGIAYTKSEVMDYYFNKDYDSINKDCSIFKNNFRIYTVPDNEKSCIYSEGYKVTSVEMDSKIYSEIFNEIICSSGDNSLIVSEGNFSQITSSGKYSLIFSTGRYSKIVVNSNFSKVISLGDGSKISVLGDSCEIFSKEYSTSISVNGDYVKIESLGEDSNIQCLGVNCKVKANRGSFVTLSERLSSGFLISKTEFVDGNKIKDNTWYELNNGEFVEYDEESD